MHKMWSERVLLGFFPQEFYQIIMPAYLLSTVKQGYSKLSLFDVVICSNLCIFVILPI